MNFKNIKKIKTAFTYFIWAFAGITILPIALVVTYITGNKRYDSRCYFFLANLFCRFCVWSTFISYSVRGAQNLPAYLKYPSIILINHSSMIDIPLVEVLLGSSPHIWMSNDYSYFPIAGRLLKRMHVIINRDEPLKALRKVLKLARSKKSHIFLFPEGTRHADGKIHDFFGGFVIMMQKLDRPVIPIVMTGLNKICPKKQYVIDSCAAKVKISIGKPMYYDPAMSNQEFVDHVKDWFVEEMNALKG